MKKFIKILLFTILCGFILGFIEDSYFWMIVIGCPLSIIWIIGLVAIAQGE